MRLRAFFISLAILGTLATLASAQHAAPPASQPGGAGEGGGGPPARGSDADKRDRAAEIVAKAMDKAHGGAIYRTRAILQCDVALVSGDVSTNAKLSYQINGNAARLDLADGRSIVFDGTECWIAPSTSEIPKDAGRARVQAWRNLVAAPFMSQDRAAKVSRFRSMMIMGTDGDAFNVQWRLSGDAPTHTLVAYAEARSHKISVIGCEALAGVLGLPEGEKAVRCIVYTEPHMFEDVLIPTKWLLYDWTEAASVRGDRLGTVTISNVRFAKQDEVSFAAPDGSRKDGDGPDAGSAAKP